jgi:hypothetical protein
MVTAWETAGLLLNWRSGGTDPKWNSGSLPQPADHGELLYSQALSSSRERIMLRPMRAACALAEIFGYRASTEVGRRGTH